MKEATSKLESRGKALEVPHLSSGKAAASSGHKM
jgi:hypothetical protein